MSNFVFVFRGGSVEYPSLSPSEMQAHMKKWHDWSNSLAQAGRRLNRAPLDPAGKTVRGRERMVTDGPYAESKDLVTGHLVIAADSLEHATELAMECPVFDYGASVEVRPVFETEA